MFFYSTKNRDHKVNFETALLQGLAPDGGLYFPEYIPKFSDRELKTLSSKTLPEIGFEVLKKFLDKELSNKEIEKITKKALNFDIPLKKVGTNYVLEVFHGPTMAFKDVAGRTLAQLMSAFLKKRNQRAVVLVATSGDTGGAVAHGFANTENIKVFVLYPKGKVSQLQKEQLTRVADNVFSIEVEGVFDDCQGYVKQVFTDKEMKKLNLTSANSINIGRLLPQIIYYVYTYTQSQAENMQIYIPSGNFGNLSGALIAKKMGIPIKKIIACVNENDSTLDYYNTGIFEGKPTVQTLSNAMDVGKPNNFPRVLELFDYKHNKFRDIIEVYKSTDQETTETMRKVYKEDDYLLDPHTAIGWNCCEKAGDKDTTNIIIGTASPKKFSHEIYKSTKIFIDNSKDIAKLKNTKKRKTRCNNNYKSVKKIILHKLGW